jgi:hypothetical protein
MKKIMLIFCVFFLPIFCQGSALLDSARNIYRGLRSLPEKEMTAGAKKLEEYLSSWIVSDEAKNISTDSMAPFSFLRSDNGTLLLLTWDFPVSSRKYFCGGLIHLPRIGKTVYLEDAGEGSSSPEQAVMNPSKWYGARYYKLISFSFKRTETYLVLGANFNDQLIRKKVIESMQVEKNGNITFGVPCFSDGRKRILLRYNPELNVSLKYEKERKRIVFDHLIPEQASLKNQYQFYGPDLSYDAFELKRGKWMFKTDIDARNDR